MAAASHDRRPARSPLLLSAATFCSGGCALLLEQIYEKYLSTLLGSSRPAATIVLATFFLGLANGGFFCPKRVFGASRRLAGLELFVALWAVLVGVAFFPSCEISGEWLAAAGGSAQSLAAMRFALAVIWILPPTIAMGAQLPTLTAVLESYGVRTPENLTRFYTINLLGGLAFTLLAPVVLFNYLGADGALWFAGGLSAAVGFALWFGLRPVNPNLAIGAEPTGASERARPFELFLATASGFVFFALEVIWFHLISAVCGASTYTFSLLLSAILLALAVSGWLVSRLAANRRAGELLFVTLSRLLPLLAVATAAWPHLGRLFQVAQTRLQLHHFWAGETLKFAVIAFAIVPPAIGLGIVFPLVLRGIDGDGAPTSRRIGWICTANVAGCVVGALCAGFVMIPKLGAERSLFALWLLIALGGAAQGWRLRHNSRSFRVTMAWAFVGSVAVFLLPRWDRLELTRGFGIYFHDSVPPGAKLVFFDENEHSGFVTVTQTTRSRDGSPIYTLLQNGKFDADNESQMPAQIGFGAVAALHAPAFGNAIVIGCGSGHTASVIERFGFEHVEIVDLSPGHFRAAREWFADLNRDVMDRPRVVTAVEDGRNWLLRSRRRYDLVQVEISSIWFAGATNLYSRQFYELIRRRLTPEGVLMQWVQLHHLTEREIGCIVATIQETLPEVTVWRVGPQACILASVEAQKVNWQAWQRWLDSPDFAMDRAISGLNSLSDVRAGLLLSSGRVRSLLSHTSYPINTDHNRWLEFQTPKYYLSQRDLVGENLQLLRSINAAAPRNEAALINRRPE